MHKEILNKKMEEIGIQLSDMQTEQFLTYYDMLIERNKVMNLTAITEYDDVVEKHFVDSVSLIKALDAEEVKNVIDIGTGAGFPGIPLKIVFPHLKVTLLDSLNKRIKFLNDYHKKTWISCPSLLYVMTELLMEKRNREIPFHFLEWQFTGKGTH